MVVLDIIILLHTGLIAIMCRVYGWFGQPFTLFYVSVYGNGVIIADFINICGWNDLLFWPL